MRVRALQDGTYAGYYRKGPVTTDDGHFPGEVFEISDEQFPVLDATGKPIHEVDEEGNIKRGQHNKPIVKMRGWFSSRWMEKVSDSTPLTAELDPAFDYPPFQIPVQYRERKQNFNVKPGVGSAKVPSSVI